MLLDLRDGIRNSKWLKYVLVTIICIPFALFGINSYFSGGGPDYAVKVNGEKVSLNAFQTAYQQRRAQIAQAFGGRIPEGFDVASMVNNQAMDSLITREVIRQSTQDNKFAISDESLAQQLLEIPEFNVDGRFDKERYQLQLQSMGVSAAEFESQYRNDLILQQFSNAVVGSGFKIASESERIETLREQKRSAETITFDVAARAEGIEISDDEVQTYYDENTSRFNNPPKVTVEYIELKVDDIESSIEVTEADLRGFYDRNKTQWVVPEKREASHILLAVDGDADDKLNEATTLLDRINSGESFEELAKEFSDDPGSGSQGGSLGEFGRGVMVPPFEEAVFAMQEGDVSDPVLSEFGYHIIRLDKIIAEHGQSFDEVREDVEQQFRTEQAENEYFNVSELLANASYENSDSLQPAADETGLEIQTSEWIDINSTEGVGQYRQVITAALSDEVLIEGLNSEVLEVGENHAIVLRTLEHEEAKPKPLDEVKTNIVSTLQRDNATEELLALAESLEESLADGEIQTIAEQNNAEYADAGAVGRSDTELDSQLTRRLFQLPKPAADADRVFDTVTTSDGNIALLIFSGVAESEQVEGESESSETATVAEGSYEPASDELQAIIATLEEGAEIERNDHLLSESAL